MILIEFMAAKLLQQTFCILKWFMDYIWSLDEPFMGNTAKE